MTAGETSSQVVWLRQSRTQREDAVAITECPVSFVTGESLALVEDFYAHELLGGAPEIARWPARRVDAFALLKGELRKVELETHGAQ